MIRILAITLIAALLAGLGLGVASAQGIVGGVITDTRSAAVNHEAVADSSQSARAAVAINFDSTTEPSTFLATTALREAFAGLGVHFTGPSALDGGGMLDELSAFLVTGHSSPNFLAFNIDASFSDGGLARGPQTITFDTPVVSVSLLAGSALDAGTATLDAFDSSDTLVDSDSITKTAALQTLAVSAPAITRVVISFTGDFLVVDDLDFNTISLPTATYWGLGALVAVLSLAGVVYIRRRKNQRA